VAHTTNRFRVGHGLLTQRILSLNTKIVNSSFELSNQQCSTVSIVIMIIIKIFFVIIITIIIIIAYRQYAQITDNG